jgi:hypothetical protein
MVRTVPFVIILFTATWCQDQPRLIGSIDFYGYKGLDLNQIRSALPLREGETYPGPLETLEGVTKTVNSVIGRPPTDVAPVCCDTKGNYMIYVGLPGASIKPAKFNSTPTGNIQFPQEIITLYEEAMEESSAAVLKGVANEDTSKGYALALKYPPLRAKQLRAREYALQHESLIHSVLSSSSETKHRIVAAYLLGYARQSSQQINSLVHAANDPDAVVRNNATRALAVLAQSSPKTAARIPATRFLEMLSSGSWSDRNKASWVLSGMTESRPPKLLADLRSKALVSLIEMARWRTPHAITFRILLGRIAGIKEERLRELANSDNADEIIKAIGAP